MLLDNKNRFDQQEYETVAEALSKQCVYGGTLSLVSGYFSVTGLVYLSKSPLFDLDEFCLILGELSSNEPLKQQKYNILTSLSIENVFSANDDARAAVDFLKKGTVGVRTLKPNFCHAKLYLYQAKTNQTNNNFMVLGSSNLTHAGLGLIKDTSNIELNYARTGNESEFRQAKDWFDNLWKKATSEVILEGLGKRNFKEYIIDQISKIYQEWTPSEVYQKILFELYRERIDELALDETTLRGIRSLEQTSVYQTLYPFQQKGVLSLIQMMQKFGGALLADAVGLGKTWQALAVIKFFEIQGYKTILLCPKKLEQNWRRYQKGQESRFEADEFEYLLVFHTDLQGERYHSSNNGLVGRLLDSRSKQRLLVVIDESHNLRNDKSTRYQTLVDNILSIKDDVRVLLLSATPINTGFKDIRNQFKLLDRGKEACFVGTKIETLNITALFSEAESAYKEWITSPNRKMADLVKKLPARLTEGLTDHLIVARNRRMVTQQLGSDGLQFPTRLAPQNLFVEPAYAAPLNSFDAIRQIMDGLAMSAYQPAQYIQAQKKKGDKDYNVLHDEQQRQRFLAMLMARLLAKRMESSWKAFQATLRNILAHHQNALDKVERYLNYRDEMLDLDEYQTLFEDLVTQDENEDLAAGLTVGKSNPIPLSKLSRIEDFKRHIEADIRRMQTLLEPLERFAKIIEAEQADTSDDHKLTELIKLLRAKQQAANPKVIIFTSYTDTANYLHQELQKRGFQNLGLVTGSGGELIEKLRRFAPYTQLYMEENWEDRLPGFVKGQTTYEQWFKLVKSNDHKTNDLLRNRIDILIATDCISEGQNLQDADTVINYDIHWNPVRLIQRLGRIDRLGSPNTTVQGINFWPAPSIDAYIKLKARVENRMAIGAITGAESLENLTPELEQIMADNPLVSAQDERMLRQMETTWDDIETHEADLGFDDLSLESFRQEIAETLKHDPHSYNRMPNGIFSGFRAQAPPNAPASPSGLVALLGYPRCPANVLAADHKYTLHHLAYATPDGHLTLLRTPEVLRFLRLHKDLPRDTPLGPDHQRNLPHLQAYRTWLLKWLQDRQPQDEKVFVDALFTVGTLSSGRNITPDATLDPSQLDLIAWMTIEPPIA